MSNNNLTAEDLEKLGVVHIGSKLHPRLHFVPYVGECNLSLPCTADGLFRQIFDRGYNAGVAIGNEEKASEIRRVLGINAD